MNQKKVYSTIVVILVLCGVIMIYGEINSAHARKLSIDKQVLQVNNEEVEIELEREVNTEYKIILNLVNKYKNSITKLVNKENGLKLDYEPDDLVRVNVKSAKNNIYMSKIAANNLEKMFESAKKDGLYLYIVSGYRSSSYQKKIYENCLRYKGKEYTEKYISQPNHSEHQTGLAADISSKSVGCKLVSSFENTKEGKWLENNAYKYGFILRYKKDREKDTGYAFEPWHFRYVGEEVAKYIHENNLILEDLYLYK